MKRAVFPLLIMALALALPSLWLARNRLLQHRAADQGRAVVVVVPRGASLKQTAAILARAKVVDHPSLFALAARLSGRAGCLQAGEYRLSPAMTYQGLLQNLCAGRVLLHSLTIPEGFTMRQIVERAATQGLLDRNQALALLHDRGFISGLGIQAPSLEGFLFPTTYRLPRGLGARAVLAMMVRRFQRVWKTLEPQARRLGLSQLQAVTLASIIEKEAQVDWERALISAVYHNRLKRGMRLQADPTVIYGLTNFDGNLRKIDLDTDTPYNTYLHPGLPPGPICSPGLASLQAAVNPAPAKYLYFVAKGNGEHHFSRSYREHQNAVIRYQKHHHRAASRGSRRGHTKHR